jgi:hypothetical protein
MGCVLIRLSMASTVEQYARELHDELHFWVAWLPGTLVKPGDCGTVDNYVFNRRSSLESFGISLELGENGTAGNLTHQSKKGVSLTFQAAGENQAIPGLPQGQVGAGIEFSRENAIVFAARDCVEVEVADLDRLGRDLMQAHRERGFPAEYVVVTTVVKAAAATVLVSRTKKASATLRAAAAVPLGGLADLAAANAGLALARSENLATQYVAESALTPLFKVAGFKTQWWNGQPTGDLESLGGPDKPLPENELQLIPADFEAYDDYVSSA